LGGKWEPAARWRPMQRRHSRSLASSEAGRRNGFVTTESPPCELSSSRPECYAAIESMRLPSLPRTSLPTTFLAASCGAGLGIVTFVLCAWLHAAGATSAAALLAEAALLIALACVAAFALFDGNTKLRGARVPINRALPPAWWPRDPDPVSLLAACVGAPLVIGAGAAVLLFR
jgi:hypothetical protein